MRCDIIISAQAYTTPTLVDLFRKEVRALRDEFLCYHIATIRDIATVLVLAQPKQFAPASQSRSDAERVFYHLCGFM